MITTRVSTINDYAWWKESGLDWDWFRNKDRDENDRMRAGTALHSWLEKSTDGDFEEGRTNGFIFVFDCDHLADCQLVIPPTREQRQHLDYGDLRVTGKVDSLDHQKITDYKLILDHQVEGEQYMDSYQWRYYLDIFGAHSFDYVIFEGHEESGDGDRMIRIRDIHRITQYRYPDLHRDCANLASEFLEAINRSPELRQIAAHGLEDAHESQNHQVKSANNG